MRLRKKKAIQNQKFQNLEEKEDIDFVPMKSNYLRIFLFYKNYANQKTLKMKKMKKKKKGQPSLYLNLKKMKIQIIIFLIMIMKIVI